MSHRVIHKIIRGQFFFKTVYAMRHHDYHEIVGLNIKHGAINDILIESQLLLLLCASIGAYTPKGQTSMPA